MIHNNKKNNNQGVFLELLVAAKNLIGNVGTWTCVGHVSQHPCYPLDHGMV